MITSWKDFFIAVERMREAQREYFLRRGFTQLAAAQKRESLVDDCIKEKRAEWARQKQPELTEETNV